MLLVLAATAVVLIGMRLAAPVLNPILFAVVLSLLFGPIYAWLKRRGIPTPLALVIMLVGLALLFSVIFYVLSASIARFSGEVGSYAAELNEQLASVEALADRVGLSNVDVREVVKPSALAGAVGVVLSGIAGFLRNLFLILMIMLFLLAEGPALMSSRLRASARKAAPHRCQLGAAGGEVGLLLGGGRGARRGRGGQGPRRGDLGRRVFKERCQRPHRARAGGARPGRRGAHPRDRPRPRRRVIRVEWGA
jgi:AI-2 transport protein TqsA